MDVEIQAKVASIRLTSNRKVEVITGSDDFGFPILACVPMGNYYIVGSRPRAPALRKSK